MNKAIGWLGIAALVAAFVFGGSWSSDRVVAQDKGGMTFEIYKDAKDEFRWRLKAGNGKIMATGHSAKNLPSRPVPHGILVSGTLEKPTEPEPKKLYESADSAVGKGSALDAQMNAPRPGDGGGKRRRRR